MCELLVVGNEVGDIDVAVVLLHQHIFADLVSVDENVVEMEVHDKVDQRLLHARGGRRILGLVTQGAAEKVDGVV